MMESIAIFLITILFAGLALQVKAQIRHFHIFDDNMVLQRHKLVKVWG